MHTNVKSYASLIEQISDFVIDCQVIDSLSLSISLSNALGHEKCILSNSVKV